MRYDSIKKQNSRLLWGDIQNRRRVFQGLPNIVNFNHSRICNLRCIMCFQAYTPGTQSVPMARCKEILDELLPSAEKLKLTTAGEPLIGNFEELVDIARHYECKLELITNATRLTLARFRTFEDVLDHIVISLDSHRKEALEKIRGKGVHGRIMKNLREIQDYMHGRHKGFVQSFHYVLMTSNVPDLADFVRFASECGSEMVTVLRMHYMTEKLRDEEDPFRNYSKGQLDLYIGEAQKEARENGVNLYLRGVGYDDVVSHFIRPLVPARIPTFACNILAQEVYIDSNEDVLPCCIPGDLKMGSLKKNRFAEIWNGRRYRRLRKQMFSRKLVGPCANCRIYTPNASGDDSAFSFLPDVAKKRPGWAAGRKKQKTLLGG